MSPSAICRQLWRALDAIGVATPNVGLVSDIISCPGLDYCSLANARSIPIAQEITRRFRNLDLARDLGRLHINISGCINACGHHHVGHIGILGVEKNGEEFYQITLGGKADENAKLGALIGPAVPYAQVADVVEDIAAAYVELRAAARRVVHRHGQAYRRRTVQGARLCHSLRQARSSRTVMCACSTTRRCRMTCRCIVPGQRFLADARELASATRRSACSGPTIAGSRNLQPWLDRLSLIALVFPKFRDGRAYSQARLLRERYAYRGELRATGDVLRDQFQFLVRAGFDAFEVKKPADAQGVRGSRGALLRCSISRAPTAACRRCAGGCKMAAPFARYAKRCKPLEPAPRARNSHIVAISC